MLRKKSVLRASSVRLDLTNLLANSALTRKEKLLILLASGNGLEMSVAALRELAIKNGLRVAKTWNISQALLSLGNAVTRLPEGWVLTDQGKEALANLGVIDSSPSKTLQPILRKYAAGITDSKVRTFIEEAITAMELKLFRSAVVLSWVGAVAVLYETVIAKHLSDFNNEALNRFPKWSSAKSIDDLARMKEYDFLQVLQAISVIGKNTKEELEHCLKLRNSCGHPNSHSIGEHRVASHMETLIL